MKLPGNRSLVTGAFHLPLANRTHHLDAKENDACPRKVLEAHHQLDDPFYRSMELTPRTASDERKKLQRHRATDGHAEAFDTSPKIVNNQVPLEPRRVLTCLFEAV
jgi:hypothetical protein